MFLFSSLFPRESSFLYIFNLVTVLIISMFMIEMTHPAPVRAEAVLNNQLAGISTETTGNVLKIRIKGSMEPVYTAYELFGPDRIVVDIANSSIAEPGKLKLPAGIPVTLKVTSITDTTPPRERFEFVVTKKPFSFKVKRVNDDIVLTLDTSTPTPARVAATGKSTAATVVAATGKNTGSKTTTDRLGSLIVQKQSIENQLPRASSLAPPTTRTAGIAQAHNNTNNKSLQDSFSFGGYNKKRISVDFYKIDLHNVFRLLGKVSHKNFVVDDSVTGSLTLSLNNVPWDFALDIILNLKDLQKEERFNTIVILPRNKQFNWPARAEDNLSFQEDKNISTRQAIIIQRQQNIPPAVVEAKVLIQQGHDFEKNEDYENALEKYQAAFEKWPKNERLANKIASIYLVRFRQNAKALFYAKKALKLNPDDSKAALNAAIALANMQQNEAAQQYFDQSVSVKKPSREALQSYAAFSEQRNRFAAALKLLARVDMQYGENLDSMVAEARILDKQGKRESATAKYKTILLSGYHVPPDLRKYIQGRIALSQSM